MEQRGGEHQSLDAGRVCLDDERACGLDVDLIGGLRIERARGIAHDRGEVHDLLHARERLAAHGPVAHVAPQHLDTGRRLFLGDVVLAVQEAVEDAHVASTVLELLHEQRTDVAAAARYQRRLCHPHSPLSSPLFA